MESSLPPRICRGCGYPYVVDESTASHMDPPDDYRRGVKRFCIACWLGVEPKDPPDLFSAPGQPERSIKGKRVWGASDTEIQSKPKHSKPQIREKPGYVINPPKPSVYLWLCCEGWMKFGPFEWLRFDDESQAILGPESEEVAKKAGGYWRVPSGRGEGMQFSNPTITTTPVHPHRNSGS